MNGPEIVAGSYLDASAVVDFVLEGTNSGRFLAESRPLILLPMCFAVAVRLLENRLRQSKPPTEWHEFASAVTRLNGELSKGADLVLYSLPLLNPREDHKEAETLATTYELDILDAMQLQQLKLAFDVDPQGTLLTVSHDLERAATREGLRARNYLREKH